MKFTFCLIVILSAFTFTIAQNTERFKIASARAEKATTILKQFTALGADSMPFDIFRRAKAVAVFNNITELNLLLSKFYQGKGVLSVQSSNETGGATGEWSAPVFLDFSGSGYEFKIAGQKNFDIVFFIMDDKTVDSFRRSGIKPGRVRGKRFALGPVVQGTGADTVIKNASIIYYTFENGQLSGEFFQNDGFFNTVGLTLDNDSNKAVYQKKAKAILTQKVSETSAPPAIDNFRQTIINSLSGNKQP